MKQFIVTLRSDNWYVTINGMATGPCFCYSERQEAVRYANMLNKLNRYPLTD